nr:hypothetical protein Iba_chr14cCG12810 [Ipomoea batatas]GMD89027.1 hypothetical protein Iba_chr14cCG12820 [Ipomoea batatas]
MNVLQIYAKAVIKNLTAIILYNIGMFQLPKHFNFLKEKLYTFNSFGIIGGN